VTAAESGSIPRSAPGIRFEIGRLHAPSLEGDRPFSELRLIAVGAPDARAWIVSAAVAERCAGVLAALGLRHAGLSEGMRMDEAAASLAGALVQPERPDPPPPRPRVDLPGVFLLPPVDPPALAAAARLALGVLGTREPAADAGLAAAANALRQALDRAREPPDDRARLIAEAAAALGLPWRRPGSFRDQVVVGEGRRQVRFDRCCALAMPSLGTRLSTDKVATKSYLAGFGVPVAPHRLVDDPRQAAEAARAIGFPVVVKPIDASSANGVTLDVRDEAELAVAVDRARAFGPRMMVEAYLDVADYRALVVRDQVFAVIRRDPPVVVGDGRSTVAELIGRHDAAIAEGRGSAGFTAPVTVDDDVQDTLARGGRTLESVPADGEPVALRRISVRIRGGRPVIVTGDTHPDNLMLFRRIAALSRLDMVAIDFRAEDVARTWRGSRFAVLEINAVPGILDLGEDEAARLARVMLAGYRDAGAIARLPVVLALMAEPSASIEAELRARLAGRGLRVGISGRDGLWLDGMPCGERPAAIADAHGRMVEDPTLDVAVHFVGPGPIRAHGLGLARIDRLLVHPALADGPEARLAVRVADRLDPLPNADEEGARALADAAAAIAGGAG